MSVLLGRDAVITVGGSTVVGVRDAAVNVATRTVDVQPFGQRDVGSYSLSSSLTLSFDTIDDAVVSTLLSAATLGTAVAVTVSGYSAFSAIVAAVTDAQPLDGVRAWSVSLVRTVAAWRS